MGTHSVPILGSPGRVLQRILMRGENASPKWAHIASPIWARILIPPGSHFRFPWAHMLVPVGSHLGSPWVFILVFQSYFIVQLFVHPVSTLGLVEVCATWHWVSDLISPKALARFFFSGGDVVWCGEQREARATAVPSGSPTGESTYSR